MTVYWDVIQKTEEWHRLRWGKVGGTSSEGLFVDSDTLLMQVLAEHTEDFQMPDDPFESKAMERGTLLEDKARERMERYISIDMGYEVELLVPGWLQSDDISIIGLSPDGITKDLKVSAEFKCPGAKKHIATVYANDIPSDNIKQSLHYFTVNPLLERHYFGSFRPESDYPLFGKLITLDSVINMGTEKTPKLKTVREWADFARGSAYKLEANLKTALAKLESI